MPEIDKFQLMEVKTKKQQEEFLRMQKNKKRNYIVGFSILGVVIILLTVIYSLAANVWLVNLSNMQYVEYSYSANAENPTATITRLKPDSGYPSNFTIPSEVNGMPVTAINASAFDGCERLTSITIPDSVTSIGEYAFANCSNLATINFSKNITSLGIGAFYNTPFLNNLPDDDITVISSILFKIGENMITENTVVLNSEESTIPTKYQNDNYNIVYLDTDEYDISVWSDGLFANMEGLVYIEIPSYLKDIPTNTFNGCINLEGVNLPDSVTSIGNSAFNGCTSLIDIEIGESVVSIGDYSFANTGVSKIDLPVSMVNIGSHAFEGCTRIEEFVWPGNLSSIPSHIFNNCTNLKSFSFDGNGFEATRSIGQYAFANTAIESFDIPKNVSVISANLFAGNSALETVRMYEGKVTYDKHGLSTTTGIVRIDVGAFDKCTNLKSIILYDDNYHNVTNTNVITLPDTVSNLASNGSIFADDTSITDVFIPYTIKETAYQMFSNNTSLKNVTFETRRVGMNIEGIESISYRSFYNCTSIEELVLPNTVDEIEDSAFENMTSLKTIVMPDSTSELTAINVRTFYNCENLQSLNLSENVYIFREYSFHHNYNLEYVYIPYNVSNRITLDRYAFTQCRPQNADGTYSSRMPIYLEVVEEDTSSTRVQNGWYDDSCVVYFLGEWEFGSDGKPVPLVEK